MKRMITTRFTERRAADRLKMASRLEAVITECGASFEREEFPNTEIFLHVRAHRGLRVSINLDGKSVAPDEHLLSWHMAYESDDALNDAAFGGTVNPIHRRKATQMAYGSDELEAVLRKTLLQAKSGEAFRPVPLAQLYELWNQLGDIPVTQAAGDEPHIETAFRHFPAGTKLEEVWSWFETQDSRFVVGEVIQGIRQAA